MFFKMLRHDLTRKKGLNLILFLFITFASLLVFVGAVQIISNVSREKTADTLCNTSDVLLMPQQEILPESQTEKLGELLAKNSNVTSWNTEKMLRISQRAMDYPDYDEEENPVLDYKIHFLCTVPEKQDMVYDLGDNPFYVPNGCIALPISVASRTGVTVGDKIRYTSPYGNVYELTVSTIFKDNALPFILRFIVSDADYEVLSADAVKAPVMYCVSLKENSADEIDALLKALEDDIAVYVLADSSNVSDEYVMMEIISVFLVIISIFLILIILMTIRFMMIAELKEEEKEIGMMKALGVDSFKFRWLFAAKYTAFAVIGGIIGVAAGIPLSGMAVGMFGPDAILPETWVMYLIGLLCVAGIIAVMIGFSLIVMRRIEKISVIDALRGENHGERFDKNAPFFLHERKRMRVPLFLAFSDLFSRLKRYLFLIVAYTLGTVILLLPFNARNSVINPDYSSVWLYHSYDFSIHLNDEQWDEIDKIETQTGKSYYDILNEQMADAGIPAHFDTMHVSSGSVTLNGKEKSCRFLWKPEEPKKITYQAGGRAPVKKYEAAMSAYTANQYGIKPGSKITVVIDEQNADRTYSEEHTHELTVTGIFDMMETGTPSVVLWGSYFDGYINYDMETGNVIDAPESEKPAVIEQLRSLYGAEQVYDAQSGIERDLSDFDGLFRTLETTVSAAVLFVLALITYLYQNVFISEEVPEIALLKSLGFRSSTLRSWHLLRILSLAGISVVLGEIIFQICGTPVFRLFMRQYEVTSIRFAFEFPVSFVVIPLAVICVVTAVTRFTLTQISRIDMRRISEE